MTVVLFTRPDSVYNDLDCDTYDAKRNALVYLGLLPVIAHPPCARWGNYAKKDDRYLGDDGGCFAHAIWCVRTFGGVIEHPAHSAAWQWFGIKPPGRAMDWTSADGVGWTCLVEQGNYGHQARKPTWLYAVGITPIPMRWGRSKATAKVAELNKEDRESTPRAFAEALINLVAQ